MREPMINMIRSTRQYKLFAAYWDPHGAGLVLIVFRVKEVNMVWSLQ